LEFCSFRAAFEQRDPVDVPQELAAEDTTKTDGKGGFVLQSIPAQGGVTARLRAAGFGSPWISFDSGQPVSIRLERAGSVAGALTGTVDKKAAAGVKLTIRRQLPPRPSDRDLFELIYFGDAMSQPDGTFRFEQVPPGRYVIHPAVDETLPYYAEPTVEFEVKPGSAITGLSIPLRPAVPVRGRVLDKDSGAGIQDVSVMLSCVDERGRFRYGTSVKTGKDGRYTAYIKPGKITVRAVLQGYFSAQGREGSPTVDAGKPVDYPDLKLVRAATLTGVVVDENGKPLPGASVYRVTPNGRTGPSISITTDGAGRFVFADLDPLENAPLRARTGTAVTAATTLITPENLAKPVRLVLSPTNASRLRGMVVDQGGQPVGGASVTVQWHFDLQSRRQPGISTSAWLEKHQSDAMGRFETTALWPGETYRVSVSAEGYGKVESTQVQAKAGQVHDLHNLVLQRTGGIVQGKIVDSKGLPIPGVLVFNNGDGPQPVQTRSDAAGRFRLEDLYQGGVFLCARKKGYRFTAKRAVMDGNEVTIRLLRTEEPITQPEARPKPPSFEEQRQVARKLLEKLWALPMQIKGTGLRTLLESMTRVDPEVAQRWAKEAGPRFENIVRTTLAEQVAETDADEALTLLAPVDNISAYYALKGLIERCTKTNATKALRFAEEAVVRARTLDQPRRTWSLAEIGSLVRQLGKEEAGRKLIGEAADMADKLGTRDYQALARGMVAQALAPYDLERAQALLKPLTDPNDKIRFATMVATATMKDDPSLPPRVRMQIAYRLGATDPAAAVRIVDSIQGDAKTQAEAFAWVAVAVAPRDEKLAYSLIDRSLAVYVDEAKAFQSWSNYGAPSVFAARVAGLARKIGYPDRDSVIARVLAVRQTNRYESPARVTESHLATALILALSDPTTAKQILRAIEPRNAVIGTGYSSIRRNFWLPAWALADLPHAVELFDRELAGLQKKDTINLQDNGMAGMIEILTIPPPERARHLLRYYGAFWFPGEE
jgi:protocatechuate 3,4-dioxygenase beta subunit